MRHYLLVQKLTSFGDMSRSFRLNRLCLSKDIAETSRQSQCRKSNFETRLPDRPFLAQYEQDAVVPNGVFCSAGEARYRFLPRWQEHRQRRSRFVTAATKAGSVRGASSIVSASRRDTATDGRSSACAASANTTISPVYREGEWTERGEITLDAAAQIIGVNKMTALRMIRRGDLKGRQVCKGAPWIIKAEDVVAFAARKRSSGSLTPNAAQQTLQFQ
jgi:Helix-turn-helix domain